MPKIQIAPGLAIDSSEVSESFIAAAGPGGQNVNKVATAVQLRFEAARSPSLDEATRLRLARLAGRRMTREGTLVIMARRHRTQERNRTEALERLLDLLRRAVEAPRRRRATRPTKASIRKRREAKLRTAQRKTERRKIDATE